ncbi:MAG: hypothetical protein ACLQE9_15585 [Roseiarcus sp.]
MPALLSFAPPEPGPNLPHYRARMRGAAGERSDTLTYGDAAGDGLFLHVGVHIGKTASATPSLFVETAQQSAELDAAVIRATSPQSYATARGPVEWTDVTLSGPGGDRSCLGFRLARTAEIEIAGLACGGRTAPLDAVALGCLIDRLFPTTAGLQAGLGAVLKGDATRLTACRRAAE